MACRTAVAAALAARDAEANCDGSRGAACHRQDPHECDRYAECPAYQTVAATQLRAKLAEAKLILNRAAGYKVDRCACVFDENDAPVTECNYHRDSKAERDQLINSIKAVIQEKYYDALDQRKHGGVAAHESLSEIQRLLGMSWQKAGG
jgi:hypothetical protein